MATNGTNGVHATNDNSGTEKNSQAYKAAHTYDPTFTQTVIDTMGPNVTPRNRQIFTSLIRHLHDFAREVELSTDEWLAGVQFINDVGQIYSPTRNEAHRISDILGVES